MESTRVFLLLIGICWLTLIRNSDAECCYSSRGWCDDGKFVRAQYCGKGKCNIFGCNCDGGCRRGTRNS
ncbi:hypothetical protein KR200_005729 [Drosophila serrata]|nr:hypothetical protein KR200_005729 [Drosophila serrata]